MGLIDDVRAAYKRDDLIQLGSVEEGPVLGFPTGIVQLDRCIGKTGGIPIGRITQIYGLPFSGKTTLALGVIANLHGSTDHSALYIDAENAIDLDYAKNCGVDLGRLLVARPEWGEQAFNIVEMAIRSGEYPIIVLDSVPALSPRAEVEGDIGDAHVGLLPRLLSQFLRRTAFAVRASGTSVILINQVRDKIGRIPGLLEPPGGYALKHHISLNIFLLSEGVVKTASGVVLGSKVKFNIKKNKVGESFGTGTFEIWADRGLNKEVSLIDLAIEKNIIIQKGSWFSYKGQNISQGMISLVNVLTENRELFNEIRRDVDNEEIQRQETV